MSKYNKGLTLIESILVIVIMSVAAILAVIPINAGMENRRAKQAAETAKSIGNAVRMYELNNDALPQQTDLSELVAQGYIQPSELAYSNQYIYTFVPNGATPKQWTIRAVSGERQIDVVNQGDHFAITDSASFVAETNG